MDNTIPTDSVLRRHYEASHSKKSHGNTSQSTTTDSSGGFMCWLKKLFGG